MAVSAGISSIEFWELTPYLKRLAIEGTHDRDVAISWLTASLGRAKKIPKLKTMLSKKQEGWDKKDMEAGLKNAFSTIKAIKKKRK